MLCSRNSTVVGILEGQEVNCGDARYRKKEGSLALLRTSVENGSDFRFCIPWWCVFLYGGKTINWRNAFLGSSRWKKLSWPKTATADTLFRLMLYIHWRSPFDRKSCKTSRMEKKIVTTRSTHKTPLFWILWTKWFHWFTANAKTSSASLWCKFLSLLFRLWCPLHVLQSGAVVLE